LGEVLFTSPIIGSDGLAVIRNEANASRAKVSAISIEHYGFSEATTITSHHVA
jgi:hypothetical protein